MRILVTSGTHCLIGRLQWEPTLTAHDPKPPINIEDPAVEAPTFVFNNTLAMMGAG